MDSRNCLKTCAAAYRRVIQIVREEASTRHPDYDLTEHEVEVLMALCRKAERIEALLRKELNQ